MPVYDYRCPQCGSEYRNVARLYDDRAEGPFCCGEPTGLVWLDSPRFFGSAQFDPFRSPVDGRLITSERAFREDLRRNNCVEYDPGIRQDQDRNAARAEKETEAMVDTLVTEVVQRGRGEG